MNAEKLTQKSQEALQLAQTKAVTFGHQQVDVAHLLVALVEPKDGLVARLLGRMNVPADAFQGALEADLRKAPKVTGPGFSADKIYLTQELAAVLAAAEQQAGKMRDEYVSVEHLFLAALAAAKAGVKEVFKAFAVDEARFLNALKEVRGNQRVQSASPECSLKSSCGCDFGRPSIFAWQAVQTVFRSGFPGFMTSPLECVASGPWHDSQFTFSCLVPLRRSVISVWHSAQEA